MYFLVPWYFTFSNMTSGENEESLGSSGITVTELQAKRPKKYSKKAILSPQKKPISII